MHRTVASSSLALVAVTKGIYSRSVQWRIMLLLNEKSSESIIFPPRITGETKRKEITASNSKRYWLDYSQKYVWCPPLIMELCFCQISHFARIRDHYQGRIAVFRVKWEFLTWLRMAWKWRKQQWRIIVYRHRWGLR